LNVRISEQELREALRPLTVRNDLTAVFHNAVFDVGMLPSGKHASEMQIHDTQKLLKLHDSDRGPDGDETGTRVARTRRGFNEPTNYKLKDVAKHVLGVGAIDFPGTMVGLPLPKLCRYLKSDLIVTGELYRTLRRKLTWSDWRYNNQLIAPITPLLVDMTEVGVSVDTKFAANECERLLALMQSINDQHVRRFALSLDCGDFRLRGWVYFELRCRKIFSGKKDLVSGRRKQLSLKSDQLRDLWKEVTGERKESLALIHDYKLVQGQMRRLAALPEYVDHRTGRIHSLFNDSQVSGRISSSKPSLQQIAREVKQGEKRECISGEFEHVQIRTRDTIVAAGNNWLVAFDIAQADVRVLAHIAESFPLDTAAHLDALYQQHESRIRRLARRHSSLPPCVSLQTATNSIIFNLGSWKK